MRSHLVVVRYETEDGRTLEATSRPMTRRTALKMVARYNVCSRPYVRGCRDTRVARVVYSWNQRRPYSVQEVEKGPKGCGRHGCRTSRPTGQAPNGPCMCVVISPGPAERPETRTNVVQGPYGPEASEHIPEDGSGAQQGGSWCEGGMPAYDRPGFLPPRKDIP